MKTPFRMQVLDGLPSQPVADQVWKEMSEQHHFDTLRAAYNAQAYLNGQPLGEGRFRVVDWETSTVVAPVSMVGKIVPIPVYQLQCQIAAGNGVGKRWVDMGSGASLNQMFSRCNKQAAVDPTEGGPYAWRIIDVRTGHAVGKPIPSVDPKGGEKCLEMATTLKAAAAIYTKASRSRRLSRRLELQAEAEQLLARLPRAA